MLSTRAIDYHAPQARPILAAARGGGGVHSRVHGPELARCPLTINYERLEDEEDGDFQENGFFVEVLS